MPVNPPPSHFNIHKRDQLNRIIAAVSLHAPWSVPLYQAVADGLINLIQPQRDSVVTRAMLDQSSRPLIVLISDDDYESTGPAGWACASTLKSWGRSAIIHAAAGEAGQYAYAVTLALVTQRFILAETSTAFQTGWQLLLTPHMQTLTIQTKENSQHPKMPPANEVH